MSKQSVMTEPGGLEVFVLRLRRFARRTPHAAIGVGLVLLFLILAIFAPWIATHDPLQANPYEVLKPPSAEFLLGTDNAGMDVFSRIIYGSRLAFGIAVPAVLIAITIGVPLGLVAGYRGGLLDEAILRTTDALRIFPSIILAMAIVAATGNSLGKIVFVIGLVDAPIFVRVVRAEVLALRSSGLVEAAVAAGNPLRRILFVHILPNAIKGALAQSAVRLAWAIRVSATLAFVGVGVQPPTPEWGAMIRQGAEQMVTGEWWVALFPGIALVMLVLGFNMCGDAVQDWLDPRRRGRAA
ncbi:MULTISPECIES: ABC transporter permease [unclassified Chelatococcus]|uniref:ABC transporter permease n=1 Tax=unclassified Chelatococcus TaxID=2638111 RepID=UPI001BD16126|nr:MULTISPECIES: ABC transporter permease [unclassified Chelatococcus]MBS7700439.1 ABC transporter permease [Chelatococcus sp. YT9]MBX3556235.1 ABC transporter permease [Chelatococcus sp.]